MAGGDRDARLDRARRGRLTRADGPRATGFAATTCAGSSIATRRGSTTHADWPLDWQDAAGASDYAVHVSPARLAALNDEFSALVERYRRGAGDPDEETVQVHLHAFPLPGDRR